MKDLIIDTVKDNPYVTMLVAFTATVGYGLFELFALLQDVGLGQ